jgi:hypothetical protein
MLQMGIMGRFILTWAKGGTLKNFKIRYSNPANENDILTFKGKITKKYKENKEKLIELTFVSENQEKKVTAQGSAIIAFKS